MEKSVLLVDDKQEIAKIIMLYLSSTYKVSYKEKSFESDRLASRRQFTGFDHL